MWMDAFITNRKAQHLSPGTIDFYRKKFKLFDNFRSKYQISSIKQITPQLIRSFLIFLEEKGHNPGGIHAAYRALKAFLNWWEEEFEPENWKNPFLKIKSPKVPQELLEPVTIETINRLLETCNSTSYFDKRDKAIFYLLADTGIRAGELININLTDINIATGEIIIRKGKGSKFRYVFLGRKSRRALRAYLHVRKSVFPALFISRNGERITYSTLRCMLRRRAKKASIATPTLHSFRRFFALEMLRNGVDVFSLQKLMGHSDLQILRTYLKQTQCDIKLASQIGSPIENLL